MTVLSAQAIAARSWMIDPFQEQGIDFGMTFGLGPCGYDVRVEFDSEGKVDEQVVMPGMFILASTVERFKMPGDLVGIVHDKSSWARRGIAVQNTVIEPGWQGWLTLEISNHSVHSVSLKRGMPIAQIMFHRLDEPTVMPYKGKYDQQARGPQKPR